MSSYQQIRLLLKQIRLKQLRRRLSTATLATIYASLIATAVGVLVLGLTYNTIIHVLVVVAWMASIVFLWARHLIVPAYRVRRDASTASLLEGTFEQLRSNVSSSLEFGRALEEGGDEAAQYYGSPALMKALVSRTAEQLETDAASLERALPRRSIGRLQSVTIGALVAFALVFLLWPAFTRSGLSRLFTGPPPALAGVSSDGDSRPEPLVSRIIVTYEFPGYTQRQRISLANPTGRIEVLAGTEVTLDALALRDVAGASLVLQTGEGETTIETEIGMEVTSRALGVRFSPLHNATYTFEVTTSNGEQLRDPVVRTISIIPDGVPQVELITPESVVQAAPGDIVPFRFAVSDDFGLTELAFVHAFAGEPDRERRQVLLDLDGQLVLQDGAAFDLGPLALQPRDEVLIHVEAVDNDTIAGPKAGRSRPVLVRITSAEDRHLALMQREEEVFEALLGVLGDYLERPISDMRVDSDGMTFEVPDLPSHQLALRYSAARNISQAVMQLLGVMRDLLGQLESDELLLRRDFEIFQSIYQRLYDLHRSEQNVLTSLGRPASRGQLSRHHLIRLDNVRTSQVAETERSILQLDEVIASQQMESLERTLEELSEVRERLRDLLEQYRITQDPELREEIERELLRLEARMRELLERLAAQVEQMPSEHYNLQALEEMGALSDPTDMADMLQQIREMLEAGDIEGALSALDNMAAEIEAMMNQVSTSEASGGGALSELDQHMNELMDAINDLAAQESELELETGVLQEEIRQERIDEIQDGLEEFVEDARRRVAEMRQALEEIERDDMRSSIAQALSEADDHLQSLDQMLEAEDFESSLERAEQVVERLASSAFQLRSLQRRFGDDTNRGRRYGESREQVETINDEATELADDLSELIERARPEPSDEDRPRMDSLAEFQDMTIEELRELLERVSEMSEGMPMIGEELTPGLGRIEGLMEGASRQLRQGRLQGAREDEQTALRQLRDLRGQMQRMVQREHMGQRVGQRSREHVEIPAEADETPSEFREEILDAMREESLDAYEEAIRRYYQSLVE